MDSETTTRHSVELLERVLLDGNAGPIDLPFSLLENITNSFSDDHKIGSGGFAEVYKGIVGKGMVAVKKLSPLSFEDKFITEIKCLSKAAKAKHKNIVRFVGYCFHTQKIIGEVGEELVIAEVPNWLLCFEYVPNGSLEKHITGASGGLEWRERYGIIKGICEGLLHLHKSDIIHLDLKPGNILVDDHMVPKIADFGLSKILDEEQSRVFLTQICGTLGYFAPEYHNREVSPTSDIYSLGVIILEILTGKKGYPEEEKVIDNWKNRLEGSDHWDVQLEQVRVCMEIGIKCMDLDPKKRPVARHIIDRIDGKISSIETTSISSLSVELQLERVLLDGNAEPMYMPLSLLEEITNCFSDEHQIGSSGSAVVYKGIVGKGMIAVKKLTRTFDLPESKFHKEVECLVKAKHKNIVRFLGYCYETQGRIEDYEGMSVMSDIRNWLLCFEYVPNGSLDKHITDVSRGLEWRERFEIIKGICEGLSHLHKMRILHLGLKPSNILIDDRMVPKIADFGLSRCLHKDQTQVSTTNLCGSIGYLAPEFFRGQLGYTTDIYSLGCIIVEILTGEKGYPEDENVVGNWVNRLEGSDNWDVQLEQVRVCIKIGIECMDLDPKKRPGARHIIDRLHGKSSVETSISSSSVEQHVSFLEEQARHIIDRLHGEASRAGTSSSSSSVKQQDAKHNVILEDATLSSTNSGLLYKLNNLDIFNTKTRRNYLANGGPLLERTKSVKLFKKVKLKPVLNESNLIRRDSFEEVYVGLVDRERVIVRKQIGITRMVENDKFANEVIIQSQILHKNIVRLIGCCVEVEIPMLVYEFLSKGSLDEILYGYNRVPLDLAMRLTIASQAAGAVAYMHSKTFLHGNIKSSNILLNDLFVPKISGISRMFAEHYENTVPINFYMDFMDPVFLQTGLLTEKSDVYSFGIVILELLTRKRATYNSLQNFLENHKKWGNSNVFFDKEIAVVTGDLERLDNLAEVVVECLNLDADQRPTMKVVAKRLSILNNSHELALIQAS